MSNGFIYVVDAHVIDKICIYLYLQFCTKIYRLHSVLSRTKVEMKQRFS